MHGKCGATYESGSLRRYHLGRTETIRSCTSEAQVFVRSMSNKHERTSNESKYQLLSDAIQAQRVYTTDVETCTTFD
jgi:carnitine O-acetyltransferase